MGTKGCVSNVDSFLYTDVTWVLAFPSLSTPQHSVNPNAKCTSKLQKHYRKLLKSESSCLTVNLYINSIDFKFLIRKHTS